MYILTKEKNQILTEYLPFLKNSEKTELKIILFACAENRVPSSEEINVDEELLNIACKNLMSYGFLSYKNAESFDTVYKKSLSEKENKIIQWLRDTTGLSEHAIMQCALYLTEQGKTEIKQLEFFVNFYIKGNYGSETEVSDFLKKRRKADILASQLQVFMNCKEFSEKQMEYIFEWSIKEYTPEAIKNAYDYTINRIQSPSFAYIDKVLASHPDGKVKKSNNSGNPDSFSQYEFDVLENLAIK